MAASGPSEGRRSLSGRSRNIVLILVFITVIAIAIAVVMAALEIHHDTLWYEIGALVAQAGILAGFGAVVTLLTHEYQQDQEESRQRSDERNQRIAARHEWLREFAFESSSAGRFCFNWSRSTAPTPRPAPVIEISASYGACFAARMPISEPSL